MYYPKCLAEYEKGFTECADCSSSKACRVKISSSSWVPANSKPQCGG